MAKIHPVSGFSQIMIYSKPYIWRIESIILNTHSMPAKANEVTQ